MLNPDFREAQLNEIKCVYRQFPISFYNENGGVDAENDFLRTLFENSDQFQRDWFRTVRDDEQIYKGFRLDRSVGCDHYITGCELECSECNKFFGCRRCHDEQVVDHQFNKFATRRVRCRFCGLEQKFQQTCEGCGESFGGQICDVCKYVAGFSDDGKPKFHCQQCNACNVGYQQFTVHCPQCNMCLSTRHAQKHVCRPSGECCVCLADLQSSKFPRRTLQCGHSLHEFCLDGLMLNQIYKCPICKRFMLQDEQREAVLRFQNGVFEKVVFLPQQWGTLKFMQCNDCGARFPDFQNSFGLSLCEKCQLFNCELTGLRDGDLADFGSV